MSDHIASKKTFVLDTDVLLTSPFSIFSFDEHNVIVVDASIEDLNKAKDWNNEKGNNAKEAIRFLENMSRQGNIAEGVQLPGGGVFRIHCKYNATPIPLNWDANDSKTRILRACKSLDENVTLVTNNLIMRLKADMIGVNTEPFKTEQMAEVERQYTGRGELLVPGNVINEMYAKTAVSIDLLHGNLCEQEMVENKYFVLHNESDPKHTGLAQYKNGFLCRVKVPEPWGLKARSVGQKFALHALMASPEEIPCVILKGGAGTGKTILSLAAALQGVMEDHTYTRCLTSRPNIQLDREIGYLKGSEEAKIGPLIRPIFDNLEQLTRIHGSVKDGSAMPNNYAQQLYDQKVMVSQALGYMRGRSINYQYIIIDEAQNMSPLQSFSIISRAGVGSKIILCGDVQQIDNMALDSRTNGLTYASERMKGSKLVAQVTFDNSECERSALAAEALKFMAPKGSM